MVFTVAQRDHIRDRLVAMACTDESIIGAAFVGSSATDQQDAWSDIDLMLQLAPDTNEPELVRRWTKRLYTDFSVVHHLDVTAGNGVRYRVFLTVDSLQMDISFWPKDAFRATGERFRLLFGESNSPETPAPENVDALIGQGWLFAIHIRSALARKQPWYALSLMDSMRDRIMMLASIRCGLNPHQLREVDLLPAPLLSKLVETRATSLQENELARAFTELIRVYQREIAAHDMELSDRLVHPLAAMIAAI